MENRQQIEAAIDGVTTFEATRKKRRQWQVVLLVLLVFLSGIPAAGDLWTLGA